MNLAANVKIRHYTINWGDISSEAIFTTVEVYKKNKQ